jgi:large subunit ribosomal protein LP0
VTSVHQKETKMVKVDKATWKTNYFAKLKRFLGEYTKIMIVKVDNVGSKQVQDIRLALRGKAEVLMGKNTMIRKCLDTLEDESLTPLRNVIKGNIGMIFTNGDLNDIVEVIEKNRKSAPARIGAISQDNVIVPKGVTTMDAQKTSFFQALNISTKITKGNIEIVSDVHILKPGDKVGPSEAALLNMLGISPFKYGMSALHIFEDGAVYSPDILSITDDVIMGKFAQGVARVTAVSLAINYPDVLSVPHMLINGYKNVLSVALATEITFPLAEKAKKFLADPSAFLAAAAPVVAAAAPAAAAPAAGGGGGKAEAPKKEEKKPEPEPEEDAGMDGFSLFD